MARSYYRLLISTSMVALVSCIQPVNAATHLNPPAQDTIKNPAEMAAQLKASGDLAAAAAMYNQALMNDPKSGELAAELCAIYRKMGQTDKALAVIQNAQRHNPGAPEVLTQLGYTLVDAAQYEAAVNVFDQLMAIKNNDAAAYNGKAVAFDSAGNHIAAQEMYRHALELSPNTTRIENNLAMSMMLNGQVREALDILKPLYAREPDNPTIRHNLAMAYGLTGDENKALELNLIDLPPQAAQENVNNYKRYAQKLVMQQEESPKNVAVAPPPKPKVQADTKPEKTVAGIPVAPETMAPSSGVVKTAEPKTVAPAPTPKRNTSSYPTKHGDWDVGLWRKK
jgi:Flp pilus assembly protein TadD